MNKDKFFEVIYDGIAVGMKVLTPRRVTNIVEIRQSGDIVYTVAGAYHKVLSKRELEAVFAELEQGEVDTSTLRKIVTSSRTCNVSTIKWLLTHLDLAEETPSRSLIRRW